MFFFSCRKLTPILALVLGTLVCTTDPLRADNWPQWRGPQGDGISRETDLPITWTEGSGVAWKCRLPEWGDSTPAIWDDAVFVTAHVGDQRLVLLRIDKQSGAIEWTRDVGIGVCRRTASLRKSSDMRRHQQFHNSHNMATPSPVTDGQVVVVHFGNGDLAAYDFDGKQLWRRNLEKDHGDYTIWWGHANSPVLHEDLVISVCMQDSCHDLPGEVSPSYLVAHDKQTGRQVWKTMRMTEATRESCDSYTTPLLRRSNGRLEMVVMGGQVLDAYAPATGQRLWHLPGLVGNRVIPSPVAAHGLIYVTQGMRQAMLAVGVEGSEKRSRDEIVWTYDQGTSDSPSPVVWGEHLYFVNNYGIIRCLDAHSGRLRWKDRIEGEYRASPIAAEGRIYFLNTNGLTTVISASSRYHKLTENQLDDETIASPAAADGKIFIRGRKWLYCLR